MRKKKLLNFLKRECKGPYVASVSTVDTVYRKDWLNRTRIIGDEYFSVDI
jgi:hypothetical protein